MVEVGVWEVGKRVLGKSVERGRVEWVLRVEGGKIGVKLGWKGMGGVVVDVRVGEEILGS